MGPWRPNWCSQSAMSDAISAFGPKRPMRHPSVFTRSGALHNFPGCARHHWGRCLARLPAPKCMYMRSRAASGGLRAPKYMYMRSRGASGAQSSPGSVWPSDGAPGALRLRCGRRMVAFGPPQLFIYARWRARSARVRCGRWMAAVRWPRTSLNRQG